jgi:hypothetical protein
MNGRRGLGWVTGLILTIALVAGIGMAAYNLGVSHGLATTTAAAPAGAPYVVVAPRYWGGPGPFFPFFPLFWLLIVFVLVRGAFWRGRWQGVPHGCGVPPQFEDWHRRAHAADDRRPSDGA